LYGKFATTWFEPIGLKESKIRIVAEVKEGKDDWYVEDKDGRKIGCSFFLGGIVLLDKPLVKSQFTYKAPGQDLYPIVISEKIQKELFDIVSRTVDLMAKYPQEKPKNKQPDKLTKKKIYIAVKIDWYVENIQWLGLWEDWNKMREDLKDMTGVDIGEELLEYYKDPNFETTEIHIEPFEIEEVDK